MHVGPNSLTIIQCLGSTFRGYRLTKLRTTLFTHPELKPSTETLNDVAQNDLCTWARTNFDEKCCGAPLTAGKAPSSAFLTVS